jgi:serine/threonine-protein kinase RsbT
LFEDTRILIASDRDVVAARQQGRAVALQAGFSVAEATLIATAISELARNIVSYAQQGCVTLKPIESVNGSAGGLTIVATDSGPGIVDLNQALRDGYSSSGGLGLGLPGVRRLMDEFDIVSRAGGGTTVTVTKWRI